MVAGVVDVSSRLSLGEDQCCMVGPNAVRIVNARPAQAEGSTPLAVEDDVIHDMRMPAVRAGSAPVGALERPPSVIRLTVVPARADARASTRFGTYRSPR